MSPVLAIADGVIFAIGGVIFIAVFTAALGLGYARFAELGEGDDEPAGSDQLSR